jgi:hypothetical protein
MTSTDHDRWSDDLAAYMLGALDPEQAAELEHHLEGCERCRAEMRWLTPAVQALPESVQRVEAPARLREGLMAEVRADAEAASVPAAAATATGAVERERYGAGGPRHRAADWLRRLGSGSLGWRPIGALAAVALVLVALAGYEIGSGGSGGGETSTISAGHAPGVTATMVREGDGGTLRLANVRQLPNDRVLEAWVRRDGKIEAVPALFVPDSGGNASTTIADMTGVDTVMVTREPKGGTKAPTGVPIVTLSVPN